MVDPISGSSNVGASSNSSPAYSAFLANAYKAQALLSRYGEGVQAYSYLYQASTVDTTGMSQDEINKVNQFAQNFQAAYPMFQYTTGVDANGNPTGSAMLPSLLPPPADDKTWMTGIFIAPYYHGWDFGDRDCPPPWGSGSSPAANVNLPDIWGGCMVKAFGGSFTNCNNDDTPYGDSTITVPNPSEFTNISNFNSFVSGQNYNVQGGLAYYDNMDFAMVGHNLKEYGTNINSYTNAVYDQIGPNMYNSQIKNAFSALFG